MSIVAQERAELLMLGLGLFRAISGFRVEGGAAP